MIRRITITRRRTRGRRGGGGGGKNISVYLTLTHMVLCPRDRTHHYA
jgi:hypothetical protein